MASCCRACMQFFVTLAKFFPVLFICAIITWSYYAYVIELCTNNIDSAVQKALYLIFYHAFLFIFLWSYYQVTFAKTGSVPPEFYLPIHEVEELENAYTNENLQKQILARCAKQLPIMCRTITGCHRYCEKCRCLKPDRCHHCSTCGTCVLKMDHHCPWVNNCVNFTNYKYFMLFLGTGAVYCLYVGFTSMPTFLSIFSDGFGIEKMQVMFLFFIGMLFSVSLISLLGYHLYLTSKNRTTLESFRSPVFVTGIDENGFNLGTTANFQEVFGDNCTKWFIPVFSGLGDGVRFPTRTATYYTAA